MLRGCPYSRYSDLDASINVAPTANFGDASDLAPLAGVFCLASALRCPFRASGLGSSVQERQALDIVDEIGNADVGCRPCNADGSDEQQESSKGCLARAGAWSVFSSQGLGLGMVWDIMQEIISVVERRRRWSTEEPCAYSRGSLAAGRGDSFGSGEASGERQPVLSLAEAGPRGRDAGCVKPSTCAHHNLPGLSATWAAWPDR